MDSNASSSFLFLLLFCIFSSNSTSMAFNITRLLSNYPDFSTFNSLLSQTGIAQQINSRQTITVLAVDNDAIGDLSGKPLDVTKRILSAHVILDYYDETKLRKLQKKSNILTTLYQTTGIADDQQGFLNVTRTVNGIMFGSAAKGAPLTASLEEVVATQPYNISVLKVSGVIQTPGIEYTSPPPPGAPKKKAPTPAPTPAMTPAEVPAPAADGPAADDAPTEAPIEAPTPAADAPEAYAPINSPPEPNSPEADAETPAVALVNHSGNSRMHVGGGVAAVVGLAAYMMGF